MHRKRSTKEGWNIPTTQTIIKIKVKSKEKKRTATKEHTISNYQPGSEGPIILDPMKLHHKLYCNLDSWQLCQ